MGVLAEIEVEGRGRRPSAFGHCLRERHAMEKVPQQRPDADTVPGGKRHADSRRGGFEPVMEGGLRKRSPLSVDNVDEQRLRWLRIVDREVSVKGAEMPSPEDPVLFGNANEFPTYLSDDQFNAQVLDSHQFPVTMPPLEFSPEVISWNSSP